MIMSCRKHNISYRTNETGFTLVELMIAIVVSGLVMAAVVTVYVAQSRSYSERDDIANIQQDLRGALVILPAEIRQAGCDPEKSGAPKILEATRNRFRFTMDIRGDAVNSNSGDGDVDDADENIAYGFTADTDNDGIVDNGGAVWTGTGSLGRQIANAGVFQPLADNIEALEINYLIDDDNNASTPLVPSLAPFNPDRIRAVQISILARAANPAQGFLNTSTYTTASGVVWNPPNDNFRRRLVVTNIQLRNMGL
jgi:type IV pilus assembly protein PilW